MTWDREAFKDKVAIVTGAATGMGEAAARAFAEHGADVVLVDLDIEGAEQVAAQCRDCGTRSFAIRADVTKAADVQAAVDAGLARLGRIDVLVNTAGGFTPAERLLVVDMPEEVWDVVVDRNLKGAFLCVRAVLPQMIKQQSGRIITVSSGAAEQTPHLTSAPYAAGKAAVLAFTRHLAKEVGQHNITVNATLPGLTLSTRIRKLYDDARLEDMRQKIPLGRAALPEDQAAAILFLASDAARYITGATLAVDGGFLC